MAINQKKVDKKAQQEDRVESNGNNSEKEDSTKSSKDDDTEGCHEWTIANQAHPHYSALTQRIRHLI
ncbi:hypothetical protein Pst134EA_001024 [Puccinia striiformis f. sp. tritici]|uniref:hypothetical protein n=1 Tax=Puccinia striiformis f. sp. tritici TaxID=168172 RepID=UPI002008C3D5|nr:hypothetical protein Pst134EA_001024 [Puccinia striiformis f. sp. tritici]KAH9467220.1 hypothetical protein Pst134EB_002243 [Puccinia striiformis f. sp. tritici]KAH9473969.1 hypothetical protein Pst134EA_001024 [Puccinia striiformis f. sp. tritici]KAI9600751.1 hypothetical protein H4Q26_000543 [Puccinia striiformis f. sp. tritici PST-130]